MPLKRRVLITGAAGRIGATVTTRLREQWEMVAPDLPGSGSWELGVTDAAAHRAAFDGVNGVVHLAAVPDPEAHWDPLLPVR